MKTTDAKLPAARKLVEILIESRAFHDDLRNRQVSARAVGSRASSYGDGELLARYENTRTYRSAIARRAVRTRRRNAAASDQGAELSLSRLNEPARM